MPIDGPQNPRRSYKQLKTENRFSPGPADQRNQAALRHPERSIYRCFLTDLAGFMNICRAGPNYADRQGRKKIGPSHSNTSFAEQAYCTPFPGFCQARFWEIQGTDIDLPVGHEMLAVAREMGVYGVIV